MEWVFWVTTMCSLVVLVVFFLLYSFSDIKCVWPPCISELMEVHKSVILLFFGFACAMVWLNLTLISLIQHDETMLIIGTAIYFSFLGIMSFDITAHRYVHYGFVLSYIATSLAYVNLASNGARDDAATAVNALTCLFAASAVFKWLAPGWEHALKYPYTFIEIGWVIALFCYTLDHSYRSRNDFNTLLTGR